MVDAISRPATFFVYAALTAAAFVFTHRLVPETKGRSLDDIQTVWVTAGMP